jgi:succinoglycan biosynthesis protein ExoA
MQLSVVIPCKNAVATIEQVLCDLAEQSLSEVFEVIVADGLSTDGTRELLARFSTANLPYNLRMVDNTVGTVSSALNIAVAEARGEYIVRVDAHCRLPREYLELIIDALHEPGKDVVGPATRYIPGAATAVAAEIALALNTRLGNGSTLSRVVLREATRVDHTVMSCYRRDVWQSVKAYDESLLTNEDFDFDYRANLQGFGVWSLPRPQYSAIARSTIPLLLQQRFRYGYWKWEVVKRHPRSLRIRQIIPVATTIGIMMSSTLSYWMPVLLSLPIAYGLILCLYSIKVSVHDGRKLRWWTLPAIYAVIHLAWGCGFLWSMGTQPRRNVLTYPMRKVDLPR